MLPELPPSTWPLDHIPDVILRIINDYLAYRACLRRGRIVKSLLHNDARPFSAELKNMSLVCWAFRDDVMGRKMVHTITLSGLDNLTKRSLQLGPHLRHHFRRLLLVGSSDKTENKKACAKLRREFVESMPNLVDFYDMTGQIVRCDQKLPSTLRTIGMRVPLGEYEPVVLPITHLDKLHIETSAKARKEHFTNKEALVFPDKVKKILQYVKVTGILHIVLPGLPTCVCSHVPRLPEDKVIKDPLPPGIRILDALEVEVPFSYIEPGGSRESHWWGYLGWLLDTPVQFQTLVIQMTWDMSTITVSDVTVPYLHQHMGLCYPKDDPRCPEPVPALDDTIDDPTRGFCELLFKKNPRLKSVAISMLKKTKSNGGSPVQFRLVSGTRLPGGTKTKPKTRISDYVNGLMVENAVQDVFEVYKEGYIPPPPHAKLSPEFLRELALGAGAEVGQSFPPHAGVVPDPVPGMHRNGPKSRNTRR